MANLKEKIKRGFEFLGILLLYFVVIPIVLFWDGPVWRCRMRLWIWWGSGRPSYEQIKPQMPMFMSRKTTWVSSWREPQQLTTTRPPLRIRPFLLPIISIFELDDQHALFLLSRGWFPLYAQPDMPMINWIAQTCTARAVFVNSVLMFESENDLLFFGMMFPEMLAHHQTRLDSELRYDSTAPNRGVFPWTWFRRQTA